MAKSKLFNNEKYHVESVPYFFGGISHVFTYPNGYTANVSRNSTDFTGQHGLWKISIAFDGQTIYNTPVHDLIIGILTDEEVEVALQEIRNLPKPIIVSK